MMDAIKVCSQCGSGGATIGCCYVGCTQYYHYKCAKAQGCSLRSEKDKFFCKLHEANTCSDGHTLSRPIGRTMNENMLSRIDDFRSDKHIPLSETSEDSSRGRVEVTIKRVSFADNWAINAFAIKNEGTKSWGLFVADGGVLDPQLKPGDVIVSLNGSRIGTGSFSSLEGVVNFMNSCTQVKITIERT
jgi:hypothetical protein